MTKKIRSFFYTGKIPITFFRFAVILLPIQSVSAQNFWEQANGPYSGWIQALAINSSGHFFAGTYGAGVFRSIDNGGSWTQTGLTVSTVWSLAINSSGAIFAGTRGGVFRSTDNGNSWTQTGLADVYCLAINSSGQIFAGRANAGVFRSTDNGGSWTQTGLTVSTVWSLAINSSGVIFAGTYGEGVFRSTDNGGSWTQTGLTNTDVRSLAINSNGQIFTGDFNGGVFRSTNNGVSWTQINTGLTNTDVFSLAINSSGQIFAGTYGGGVFRSTDNGSSWTQINTGLTNTDVRSFAINLSGVIFAGTYRTGVFRSTDNGGSWTQTGLTNTKVVSLAINSNGQIFAGTSLGAVFPYLPELPLPPTGTNLGVFRSTDNGGSWSQTGLTNTDVFSLAINSSGVIFAGTQDGVFRSTDNGNSWTQTGLMNSQIISLAINSSGQIFAGEVTGPGRDSAVFRSTDNGSSWTKTGLEDESVYSLAINSSGHIFAGTYAGGVFRSTDNGGSWTQINTGLTNGFVFSLAINSSGVIFNGTYGGGVFRSTDNGGSWTQINSGLTNTQVMSLAINSSGVIFAGTVGGGVFRSSGILQQPIATAVLDAGLGDKLIVKWRSPLDETGIAEYQIGYGTTPGVYVGLSTHLATGQPTYQDIVRGLQPNTLYYVAVRSRNGNTGQVSSWTIATTAVAPTLPVVLVHGWGKGNPGIWGDNNRGYVKWLHDAGFAHVWVCDKINSCGYQGESQFDLNAKALGEFIEDSITSYSNSYSVQPNEYVAINVIAHSMGGLISRRYISDPNPNWVQRRVGEIFMFGTPNAGTEAGTKNCTNRFVCCIGPAAYEMSPENIKWFNQNFGNRPGTAYYVVAGTGGMRSCDPKIPYLNCYGIVLGDILDCPNDGVVSVASVLGGPDRVFRATDKTIRFLCHSDYYDSQDLFNTFVEPKLKSQTFLSVASVESSVDSHMANDSGQAQIFRKFCSEFITGALIVDSFWVESSHSFTVAVVVEDSAATFTLKTPSDTLIDSSAGVLDTNVYFGHLFNIRTFSITNPEPGLWKAYLQTSVGGRDSNVCFIAGVGSDVLMTTDLLPRDVLPGDSIVVLARLTESGLPLTGVSISVLPVAFRADTLPVFSLFDDGAHRDSSAGDGVYGAVFTQTGDSGLVTFNVVATGLAPSVGSFRREASLVASISLGAPCIILGYRGDVNNDATTDIVDIVTLINDVVFSTGLPNPLAGDTDCDGVRDIVDIILLIQYVVFGTPSPCCL